MSCHELNEQNEANDDEADDYDEESGEPDYVVEEFRQFENQHKPNLEETETVNLGDSECVKEVKISTHLNETQKESLVHLVAEYSDVFVWEVSDMQGLSTDVVSHKLPINPGFEPVKQKTRKFKPELSLKIKEEITKQIESRLVEVTQYPTWLANVVPVAKKDGKIRICVDYRDLNKASPKDNFPLPNIHILIDNCAKHEMQSFVDCYAGYHQILMDEEELETFNNLSDEVVIYRGVSNSDNNDPHALSWTLDKNIAKKFCQRGIQSNPTVLERKVSKDKIFCYFAGEQEVIVDTF